MQRDVFHYLKEHLNVYWLRPESALWDAIASYEINKLEIPSIDVDLGSGNGIFSFITAGGEFSDAFDWFIQADITEKDKNVFESFDPNRFRKEFIKKQPDIPYKIAFDKSSVMLEQAKTLRWYEEFREGDINEGYPFTDESIESIFSNIIYWTADPNPSMKELRRVLKKGGKAILCLPDRKFVEFCPSYKSALPLYRWLYKLNRGRASCIAKYFTLAEVKGLAKKHDFRLLYHKTYLTRELLLFWDVGLRPIIRQLLKMVSYLDDKERLEVKKEWSSQLFDDLSPVVERELNVDVPRGFHLCVLEKK